MTTTAAPDVPDRLGDDLVRISSREWMVRSRRSSPGAYWRVQTYDGNEPICSCPRGRSLGNLGDLTLRSDACHHVRVAIDFEVKRDRLAHPRPTPPPAPGSMFVD